MILSALPLDYDQLARECVVLAEDPNNRRFQDEFLDLARAWMELAMEEEAKSKSLS
jgi:hypothetical protein